MNNILKKVHFKDNRTSSINLGEWTPGSSKPDVYLPAMAVFFSFAQASLIECQPNAQNLLILFL